MTILRLILGDQLNPSHSWFSQRRDDVVYLLIEMRQETDYVLHHAQKILAIFAAMTTMGGDPATEAWPGAVLMLVTLAALVTIAVLFRDFLLLVIAAVGALQGMPIAMSIFFPGLLWAALALLVIGAALIGAAIVIARSRRRERAVSAPRRDWSKGSRPVAITASALALVGTAAAVVTTSLIS